MPRFMDYHDDLKLPQEAIEQTAQGTREGTAGEFGVRQIELHHNADGKVYCLVDGPTRRPSASTMRRPTSAAATRTRSTVRSEPARGRRRYPMQAPEGRRARFVRKNQTIGQIGALASRDGMLRDLARHGSVWAGSPIWRSRGHAGRGSAIEGIERSSPGG